MHKCAIAFFLTATAFSSSVEAETLNPTNTTPSTSAGSSSVVVVQLPEHDNFFIVSSDGSKLTAIDCSVDAAPQKVTCGKPTTVPRE